ncbi:IclR family transcriptional regulator [Bordetella bronchiseptica]|uniref:IclR family transcriptional regulator n=1 Tax=Bordetella bronchiseptica TaxID=518 RepID=UPI00028FD486|nr:IclR family transcriptional regulator [Bordetella bronchiseptica]AZW29796.1 IclR family transcriptional regulator [Bordetella bronchiseptica]KAK73677.1 transcriptional regulator, IclR family, C-terminal domain protein [Bordetella bronchiseptica MO211]KCV39418.1 transcriptional regulator, IclR family, C-terminal domain protein [Bordetella bronchiseptica 345]KDC37673.1 transcriptional regulator, IclR family, C-terminal domain protein [Bordetella bronchiseptica GA96-01]KDC87643.1 transcription
MPTFVSAAARAMAVFEVFAREKRELSNSDLARLLELPDSSCLDLLHTLHQLGYLLRTQSRRYYPTGKLLQAAQQISTFDLVVHATRDALEQLSQQTGETAYVGRIEGAAVKIVAVREGRYPLRYILNLGDRIALHASAMGKALLGRLPPDEARKLLKTKQLRKLTATTVTEPEALVEEVVASRERGWYHTRGEGSDGADALAVSGLLSDEPIAIAISGPTDRFSANRDEYIAALRAEAARLFPNDA